LYKNLMVTISLVLDIVVHMREDEE